MNVNRTRTASLSTLIALLAASLVALPASAQAPPGAAEPGQELKVTDPRGDTGLFGSPVFVPGNDGIDLVSLRVGGEDVDGLEIDVGLANAKALNSLPVDFQSAYVDATFRLEGTSATYTLIWYLDQVIRPGSDPKGSEPVGSNFCIRFEARSCRYQRVVTSIDWDNSLLKAYVPKSSLMGKETVGRSFDPGPAQPILLGPGSQLNGFYVFSRGGIFFSYISDRMPDGGVAGPYVMAHPASNDRIRIALHQGLEADGSSQPSPAPEFGLPSFADFPNVPVTPGSSTPIQIAMINQNAGKRILQLKAALMDDKASSKWDVRIVPSITVPGDQARVVNLIVNVTANVEHLESAVVRVEAKSAGFADEFGSLKLRLVSAVPPAPQRRDLFLHAANRFTGGFCFPQSACGGPRYWLNTLEKDPRGNLDQGVYMRTSGTNLVNGVDYALTFTLDAALQNDVVLATNQDAVAEIRFSSQVPLQSGTVRVQVIAGEALVGEGSGPWTGSAPASVKFTPLADASRIPKGSLIQMRIVLSIPLASGGVTTFGLVTPQVVPQGSKLTLPVIPDPQPKERVVIPAGPAFITFSAEGDTEDFVNPGRIKVFEATVVNEGVQEDVVSITFTKDPETWYVDLKPGSSYRLKAGESATFGILVKPPGDAKEGERGQIVLNATSQADPNALASLLITAIVTEGVDIPDESENYTADEDTAQALEAESEGKSPGPAALGALAAAGAAAWMGRRRRRRA